MANIPYYSVAPTFDVSNIMQSFAEDRAFRRFHFNYDLLIDEDEVSVEDFDGNMKTLKRQHECTAYLQTHPDPKRQKIIVNMNNTIPKVNYVQFARENASGLFSGNTNPSTSGNRYVYNEQRCAHVEKEDKPDVVTSQNHLIDPEIPQKQEPRSSEKNDAMKVHKKKYEYVLPPHHRPEKLTLREQWNKRYNDLLEFKKDNGHCNVPKRYKQNKQLGFWVSHQRYEHKMLREGKVSHITTSRVKLLESVGFEWNPLHDQWHLRYEELVEYKKQNGNSNVPKSYAKNPKLAKWVTNQRSQFKKMCDGKPSHISPERMEKLNKIGFEWSPDRKSHEAWQQRFQELVEFKKKKGHCNIPHRYKENVQLGRWVDNQRYQYKMMVEGRHSHLTVERIQCLERVGFSWSNKS